MLRYYPALLLLLTALIGSSCDKKPAASDIPSGDYWKEQGTDHILDYWTINARDTAEGAFYTFLDRRWQPYKGNEKHPGMISRHIFSYSVGYLLSGDDEYLRLAGQAADYLIEHGWDHKYGGWYNSLDRYGNVTDSAKDGFFQPYAITGLAMYYFVTHDKKALSYIQQSNEIMETYARDQEFGGYYRSLNRDLSVQSSNKDFSPQLAPVSGYLIYLYLATRDELYLKQMERIMDLVTTKMSPPGEPWILERFDRRWNYTYQAREDGTELNTGHNIEVVWMLLRLYELTGRDDYLQRATVLQQEVYEYGFADNVGVWYHRTGRSDPLLHNESSPWWIQAYGNMCSLYLYHIKGDREFLDIFKKGAEFWNRYFMDDKYGAAYLSVNINGNIDKASKAVRTKTSYHSMEHAMINYIYTSLLVGKEPVRLYFKISEAVPGEKLFPLPVEPSSFTVSRVMINRESWSDFAAAKGFIRLPGWKDMEIEVIVENK